jgi:hypothetical protein
MSAHAAAFAVVQVGHEEPIFLVNAALWAVDLTEAALDAFLMIDHWHESPPGTSLCDAGAARIYKSPCLYLHHETLS